MRFVQHVATISLSAMVVAIPSISQSAGVQSGNADNPDEMIPEVIPAKEKYGHDIYGLIALQLAGRNYDDTSNNNGVQLNNESRLGWRGFAHFDALPRDTTFIWQIEAGYVDPSFSNQNGSYLGNRDTFIGLENESMGLLRLGRVLTPLYELVDWPGSNPGLGDIWDWGGSIAGVDYNDRQSDTIRWDSNELWKGFTLDIAIGAGQDRDGETDSDKADSNYYHGMAAHQAFSYGNGSHVQLDLAYEMNYRSKKEINQNRATCSSVDPCYWDNITYLAGVQGLQTVGGESIGYFAQYRHGKAEDKSSNNNPDQKERGYTAGLMYNFGQDNKWQAKVAYAELENVEISGQSDEATKKYVTSGQLMYSIDSNAIVYVRCRTLNYDAPSDSDWKEASAGIEYWF